MIRPFLLALVMALPVATTSGPARAETPVTVTVALDWTLNTNHIGLIVARDRGLYAQAGLEVEILPFSDTSSAALLAGGVADFGYLTALGFMSARAGGADVTALWATMQRETGRLVYNSDNTAITRPADLSGKTYAGFGSAWEAALMLRDGGQFDGAQVIGRDWIEASGRPQTRSPFSGLGYGLGWFISDTGWVIARGYGGQVIAANPPRGLAVAITSDPTQAARSGGYFGDLMRLLDGPILSLA